MAPRSEKRKPIMSCSEVVTAAQERSAARRSKPQPWIARKLTIGLVVGQELQLIEILCRRTYGIVTVIFGYSVYAYIVRLCLPGIRREEGRPVGHTTASKSGFL